MDLFEWYREAADPDIDAFIAYEQVALEDESEGVTGNPPIFGSRQK